ncbi:MAG: helix-turn-helix transcriptional regulator, partial [Deltaproteobacteria bacterium]|nr:helix-turn-helix transcriptional regulator [Deltaproteobacteria bacterium]
MDDSSLNAGDVADILKVAKNTVYSLVKTKRLSHYRVGRKLRFSRRDVENYKNSLRVSSDPPDSKSGDGGPEKAGETGGFIICGQDGILDVLASTLEKVPGLDKRPLRVFMGSYGGLSALYRGEVHAATSHLWDGDDGVYNLPYVRRLLPGIPCVLIHLTLRTQGFFVAGGNPKNIRGWEDLGRPDITIVNREKGAGSRVLLDERLRLMKIPGKAVKGYPREETNHLLVAGTVGRGEADLG